jgi:hypothetical protein
MNWLKREYRRCLVDMHIEDWNEEFLSKFEPSEYINTMEKAGVKGVMIYAHSHVGLCNWPTKAGQMHRGLKGRDIVDETFRLAHSKGMDVILYYSLIYDNWAYDAHPGWRIKDVRGRNSREGNWHGKRYGWCCPNNLEYREYTRTQIEDFCGRYDFESVFFDMLFWPEVCYCDSCRERYFRETGCELPVVIDWNDSGWNRFQKAREEWLAEFGKMATDTVKKVKPDVTVTHNWANMFNFWRFGVNTVAAGASDYGSGDFYRGSEGSSFICKYMYNSVEDYEYLTSRCTGLDDHTTNKPIEELEERAYVALANKGAFMFIDAIDPVGTLNPRVYEGLGQIFANVEKYEPFIGGVMRQDVAVYFSLSSKMDFRDNGKKVDEPLSELIPHLEAAVNVSAILKERHIPFGVISKKNIRQLDSYKMILLPEVMLMDEEEIEAFRSYVLNGGKLYASGGRVAQYLSDVLGLEYIGETHEKATYAAPCNKGTELLSMFTASHPMALRGSQALAGAADDVEIMATVTLPYTDPADGEKFASIHSNPPGIPTTYPAMTARRFGKGKVLWAAGCIEGIRSPMHMDVVENIIRYLEPGPFSYSADAHSSLEITVFDQEDQNRIIINAVNTMEVYPQVPIDNIFVKVDMRGHKPAGAVLLPEGEKIEMCEQGRTAIVKIPATRVFNMAAIYY